MNRSVFVLVLASVLLSAIAQIMLKTGMSHPDVVSAGAKGVSAGMIRAVALNPMVLAGLALYFGSALIWLLVLARIDVGLAYPFVALGFVVTIFLAWAFRGEVPTAGRISGALIICAGVLVLARS